jgi:DNA-binding XRE family transcriptional regulator
VSELRAKFGISQEEFAHRFGISLRTLQQWEQNVARRTDPRSSYCASSNSSPKPSNTSFADAVSGRD